MKLRMLLFNLILLAGCGLLGSGCASGGPSAAKVKNPTILRFHLEVNPDGTGRNGPVTVNRSSPFTVNVHSDPFLTENNVTDAGVVEDSLGGFFIRVQFNRQGSWLLEQFTTASKGKRVAIFTQFDQTARWLAAPVMNTRIANGTFAFTPDATREEATRIVLGLNQLGKHIKKEDR